MNTARHATPLLILRVPGIYGPGRLPLNLTKRGAPVVCPVDTPWCNRFHAAQNDTPPGTYNVSDDNAFEHDGLHPSNG